MRTREGVVLYCRALDAVYRASGRPGTFVMFCIASFWREWGERFRCGNKWKIEVFDRELTSDLPFVNELAERVRQYRGKLLRPRLLLLSGVAAGGIRREHEVLGAVVEMVHMATLVHDDVLDEADVRRHAPTVNRLIGNEGAVLLGDYLISHSYHLCSSLDSTYAARRIAEELGP